MAPGSAHIGTKYVWGGEAPLVLSPSDRFRHLYIIGQTGTGKSTLLREMIAQDIAAGEGCALIDPHGDLADDVLALVPKRRVRDVVIFDPSDYDRPVSLNPFYRVAPDARALVARNLVSAMHYIWAESWGPRLDYILMNVFRGILDAPDHLRPSFLSVPVFLTDWRYRKEIMQHVRDPLVGRNLEKIFEIWPERQREEALSLVENKIAAILENPFIFNSISQWKPTIDLAAIMAERKVLIARLPKGQLGEDPANLAGAMLVAGFTHAAFARPVEERKRFHLIVDEFQNVASGAFEVILSEARKYMLSMCLSHQFSAQLSDELRDAVFGNVGSIVSFAVGARDAEKIKSELGAYQPELYRSLSRGRFVARVVANGQPQNAVPGWTTPRPVPRPGHAMAVSNWCRDAYARPRADVERDRAQWLSQFRLSR